MSGQLFASYSRPSGASRSISIGRPAACLFVCLPIGCLMTARRRRRRRRRLAPAIMKPSSRFPLRFYRSKTEPTRKESNQRETPTLVVGRQPLRNEPERLPSSSFVLVQAAAASAAIQLRALIITATATLTTSEHHNHNHNHANHVMIMIIIINIIIMLMLIEFLCARSLALISTAAFQHSIISPDFLRRQLSSRSSLSLNSQSQSRRRKLARCVAATLPGSPVAYKPTELGLSSRVANPPTNRPTSMSMQMAIPNEGKQRVYEPLKRPSWWSNNRVSREQQQR